jgi:hypothetical protein
MIASLKFAFFTFYLAFMCDVKCWPNGLEVAEKCKHLDLELQYGHYGNVLERYNGCYLGCVLEATGVIERVNETLLFGQLLVGSYRVNVSCYITLKCFKYFRLKLSVHI